MWLALKLYASKVWTFLLPIIKIFLSNIGPVLADIAMQTVSTYALSDITNDDKRQAAFASIMNQLKEKGMVVAASTVNTAIELAYQRYKADHPSTT
jgi:hypothetical protein